jgi:uncharacterized protein
MQFNVSQLLREPVGSSRRFSLLPQNPVLRGCVELIRTPGGVLVLAEAGVELQAQCSRCLATFGYTTDIAFEEVYLQQVDVHTGVRLNVQREPEDFLIDAHHTIDISEAVRQYTETAAAMQPLCRPDCPGICAECGMDLSMGNCGCGHGLADGRWSVLAALKRTNG